MSFLGKLNSHYTLEINLNTCYNINVMSNYDKLIKLIDKEVISVNELRQLTNDDLVVGVSVAKPDTRHSSCTKYDIRLENGELHYVYVKV